MSTTIEKRQNKSKELIIEQLKEIPIVEITCKKIGVGRATYYRWLKEDKEFAKNSDEALREGSFLINDMAESQIISAIRNQNLTAAIYWLKHHHPAYTTKVEVTTTARLEDENLTPEQEELVQKALKMASLTDKEGT